MEIKLFDKLVGNLPLEICHFRTPLKHSSVLELAVMQPASVGTYLERVKN